MTSAQDVLDDGQDDDERVEAVLHLRRKLLQREVLANLQGPRPDEGPHEKMYDQSPGKNFAHGQILINYRIVFSKILWSWCHGIQQNDTRMNESIQNGVSWLNDCSAECDN